MKRIFPYITALIPIISPSAALAQDDGISLIIPTPANLRITNIGKFISAILGAILIIATIAAFVYLLIGGFTWITSGGDKANVEASQKRIQAAIIGLFIVFAAWALMILIGRFLGVNPFDFIIPTAFE